MWGRLAARRPPLLFCSPSSLQSGAYSCILFSQYKTNGGKAMRFLLKLLFAPVMAVLAVVSWFLVFVVGLSSGILCIPAAILGFFGLFIIFVDSVSYGVGLLVIAFLISPTGFLCWRAGWWQSSMSYVYASGLDIWIRLFSETPHQAKARSISPRAFRFIRSRNPHCRRPLRWCRRSTYSSP